MKTNTHLAALCGVALCLLAAPAAHAVTTALSYHLEFSPADQTVPLGNPASVDIIATESGDPNNDLHAMGAFQFVVTYDPGIVDFTSATGGTALDFSLLGLIVTEPAVGQIKLEQVSTEIPADLVASQPSSFRLATLNFDTLSVGISPLRFSDVVLSDEFGGPPPVPNTTSPGSIRVVEKRPPGVPDGGTTLVLLSGALAGLGGVRCLAKRRSREQS